MPRIAFSNPATKQDEFTTLFSLVSPSNPLPSTASLSSSDSRTIVHLLWRTMILKNLSLHQVLLSLSELGFKVCVRTRRWRQGRKPTTIYVSLFFSILDHTSLRQMHRGSSTVSVQVTRGNKGSVVHQDVGCWVFFSLCVLVGGKKYQSDRTVRIV